MQHEEDREQAMLCQWLDAKGYLYFAIPNGGARNAVTGALLKKTGVKAGVPDMFVCEPHGTRSGLFIEMKREHGGTVSQNQKKWIAELEAKGYRAVVCRGFIDATRRVEEYFDIGG